MLFVLPPCATSPTLDLAVLALIGLRAGWTLADLGDELPRLDPRVQLPRARAS